MAPIAHYVASGFWHIPPIIVLLGSSLFSEVREQATQAAHYLVLYNSLDQTIREASEGVANPEGSICAYASAFPILHTTGRYTRWCFVPWSFPTYMIDLVGMKRRFLNFSYYIVGTWGTFVQFPLQFCQLCGQANHQLPDCH